ncbi:MAG: class I adenylate-forming enzyme family protein [Ardenticatenaceae bacterium]
MILHSQERINEYTANGWWGSDTIIDLWERQVEARGDGLAVADPLNRVSFTGGTPQRWSYAEMDAQASRLAAVLVAHGVGKDDVLGVQLPNIGELVMVYVAAARIGAIVSPFAVQYREHELVQLGNFVEVKALVTAARVGTRELASESLALQDQIASLETVLAVGDNVPEGAVALTPLLEADDANRSAGLSDYLSNLQVNANDVFTICWTSGTESMPKGVPRTHNDWFAISLAVYDAAELTPADSILCPFPIVNMGGIGGMMIPWLMSGGQFILHQPFHMPTFFKQVVVHKISYTVMPPAALNLLLMREEMLAKIDISSIRQIGSGSAPLSPWMVKGWQEKHGIMVSNFFGANEGTALISTPQDFPDPEKRALYFPRFGVEGFEWSSPVAKSMKTRLVDLNTGEVITEAGKLGELRVMGPTIFAGYYKGDERGIQAFDEDGYFMTGDIFEIAGEGEDARYYRFVDRAKDIIIRGGMNISAAEVESLLQAHPDLVEVAAVGYPDKVLGERVCVFVVPKDGADVTLDSVVAFMKEKNIASYKLPQRLEPINTLPRNPVGKILKRQLREQLRSA